MMIRFHLDEHIHSGVAAGLRAHGIDVTTAADAGLLRADDPQHMSFALSETLVIVTHDDDFVAFHAQGIAHAGIAFCHQRKYSVGEHLRMLLLLHACYTAEEMIGRVEYL
ncbi:MAG: DUF5615 family PIN-like protein [Pirellulales bacterium]